MASVFLRRSVQLAGVLLTLGLTIVWLSWPRALPPPDWTSQYDVAAHHPEEIAPGTVVEDSPPVGWSNLVITSRPHVRADQASAFPVLTRQHTVRMATWMFTAFAADVVPLTQEGKNRFRLRAGRSRARSEG